MLYLIISPVILQTGGSNTTVGLTYKPSGLKSAGLVGSAVGVTEGVAVGLGVTVGVAVGLGVTLGVVVGLGVTLGVAVGLGVTLTLGFFFKISAGLSLLLPGKVPEIERLRSVLLPFGKENSTIDKASSIINRRPVKVFQERFIG